MTAYQTIFEASIDAYGLITTAQAKSIGISRDILTKLVSRGKLLRVGHGLYKLACPLPYSEDFAPYAQAVAQVGSDAYLYGESVLAMLKLSPTNPTRMYVATPRRVRKHFDEGLRVLQVEGTQDVTYYGSVPSQSAADAIRCCIGHIMTDRLEQAIVNGVKKDYFDATTARKLRKEVCAHGEKA